MIRRPPRSTRTDTLFPYTTLFRSLLGRESIEARMVAAGHSTPSRNIPFFTTVEAFALKGNNFADQRAAFLAGHDAAQPRVIAGNPDRLIPDKDDRVSFVAAHSFIDRLEWLSHPNHRTPRLTHT